MMFADFLKTLMTSEPQPLSDQDARLALTALLVRLARTDGVYSTSEIERIDKIVVARYGMPEAEAKDLRSRAETLESEAPDTVRFTRAIKDAVAYGDRMAVVEALWTVALADGERGAEEDALIRLVSNFLGIKDRDSAMARQRVDRAE